MVRRLPGPPELPGRVDTAARDEPTFGGTRRVRAPRPPAPRRSPGPGGVALDSRYFCCDTVFGRVVMAPRVDAQALTSNIVLFGRMLMRSGLPVDAQQTRLFARAVAQLGFSEKHDVKAAGRTIFTRSPEHRRVYDAAFEMFWRRSTAVGGVSRRLPRVRQTERPQPDVSLEDMEERAVHTATVESMSTPVGASSREQLRTADFAELTPREMRDAGAMLDALRIRLPRRPSRRPRIDRRGSRVAPRAMLRRMLGTGGEAVDWRWFRRSTRPRPIVLVCDVSGSMERYTRFMLRFAHALTRSGAPVEVFVFGTRLTRITRELRANHPDAALRNVAGKVVDWSGGTRIGESLAELNQRWVRRTVRSGAIVLLVSDGWERGDPRTLAREMATLHRSCHRLIWLDPLASRPGFEPTTLGLRAALPHVDALLPCASVASLEAFARNLTGFVGRG